MDGQRGDHNNLLMSLNDSGGNANANANANANGSEYPYDYAEDPNPLFPVAAGRPTVNLQLNPQSLSQWIDCPKPPHSYVEFLTENLAKVPTADILESIGSPLGGDGISEFQTDLVHNSSGKAFTSEPDNYSLESEYVKLKLSAYTANSCNLEASASERIFQQHDVLSVSGFSSLEYNPLGQSNHTFWKQEPNQDDCNVFQFQSKETSSAPSFLSQPRHAVPKSGASESDRQRRQRITEGIRALQELLPSSSARGQATAMDDIIDHVKFLQLQIKELSRSRLGGEPTSNPFVSLEGHGHYALHNLEEMMGKLIEINPSAATHLLESRGLYMMPRALVDGLHRAT